jgi:hypothetical protein
MRKRSRGKFGAVHALALINAAKTTIGIQEGVEGLGFWIYSTFSCN